ncbi:MAG: hypothetical protein GXO89_17140 [Chlorobi bacterium]|nr:hypothetical protein [Chlorobiota bacterium]
MRKPLLFLSMLFTLVPLSLFGQNERGKSIALDASFSYNYLEDLKFHIQFAHTFKRHEPFFGLEFPIGSSPVSNFGFNAGYRFYPNRQKQNFDFFFIYLMQGESRKLYSKSTVNGFSLHNLLGYGFNIYLTDKLFLKHHIVAGVENAWFGNHGKFTDFSLMINFGIGMIIKTPRK